MCASVYCCCVIRFQVPQECSPPSRGTPPTTEDEIDKPKEPEKPEYTLVNSLLTFTKSEVGSQTEYTVHWWTVC